MHLRNMAKNKIGWLGGKGPNSEVILSSRIRLARNIESIPFPNRANIEEGEHIFEEVVTACRRSNFLKNCQVIKLIDYDRIDRQFLMERHLISYEHARGKGSRGLAIGDKEIVSVMINEEDHIRLQGMNPGLQLRETWFILDRLDNELGKSLQYAYSPKLGFLTACPTNVGTGIRISVLAHLVGLVVKEDVNRVLQALSKIGMMARGFYGEGTRVLGDFFQISNQVTLGQNEETIIDNLEKVTKQVIGYENAAREYLFNEEKSRIEDNIYRAYGILTQTRRISFEETMELLSKVRMGIYLKLALPIDIQILNELMVITQPAHLQEVRGSELTQAERDIVRAEIIREGLS